MQAFFKRLYGLVHIKILAVSVSSPEQPPATFHVIRCLQKMMGKDFNAFILLGNSDLEDGNNTFSQTVNFIKF